MQSMVPYIMMSVNSEDGSVNDWCNNIADAINAALALDGGLDAVFPNYSDDRNFSELNYILMNVISTGEERRLKSVLVGLDTTFADSDTNAIDLITTHLVWMIKVILLIFARS